LEFGPQKKVFFLHNVSLHSMPSIIFYISLLDFILSLNIEIKEKNIIYIQKL
jgi:hypothetical protein